MIERTKLYYLASPYSHKVKKVQIARYEEITRIAARLIEDWGLKLITPITSSCAITKYMRDQSGTFDKWKGLDFTYIDRCDGIIVILMDGWDKSIGVQAEIAYAYERGKEVHYMTPELQETDR